MCLDYHLDVSKYFKLSNSTYLIPVLTPERVEHPNIYHNLPSEDFNDWGSDPEGAAKAAARAMTLTWQKSWEIPKMPLGTAELCLAAGFMHIFVHFFQVFLDLTPGMMDGG